MMSVVLLREPKDKLEFGSWVDALNQGASLEGVYNGLVDSSEYRNLEAQTSAAPLAAIKAFREEVTKLEAELAKPTVLGDFGLASIFLLKRTLGEEALKVIHEKQLPDPTSSPKLGDAKLSPSESHSPQKLALWYARWAAHMAERKIDFGLPLRNQGDEAFHLKWAMNATPDQLTWEVLNRLHRVINSLSH
ncbi:unnamed protein product [Sphagnum tenellum]